ncbi:MAG: hypothetical protein LBL28_05960 [Treponema sp.]|jgi:hypothetical protein|nr:hypothetical protein [Treponema sp.]
MLHPACGLAGGAKDWEELVVKHILDSPAPLIMYWLLHAFPPSTYLMPDRERGAGDSPAERRALGY